MADFDQLIILLLILKCDGGSVKWNSLIADIFVYQEIAAIIMGI